MNGTKTRTAKIGTQTSRMARWVWSAVRVSAALLSTFKDVMRSGFASRVTIAFGLVLFGLVLDAPLWSGDEGLVAHWLFDGVHAAGAGAGAKQTDQRAKPVFLDQARAHHADALGAIVFQADPPALRLDGRSTSLLVSQGSWPVDLPRMRLTAEAWIAVDEPIEWGGIIGFIQDNGGFEKGWILGTRNDHFTFALSTEGANDGDGLLTYLSAKTPFEPGCWYHVAGTYDGKQQRLYVNGKLENSSTAQSGAISFPEESFFEIGAYHDANECYRLEGALHEVRLYNRALRPAEVRAHYERKSSLLPGPLALDQAPRITWVAADAVELCWSTAEKGTVEVRYGDGDAPGWPHRVAGAKRGKEHRVLFAALEPERTYRYRIYWTGADGSYRISSIYSFDTPVIEDPGYFPDLPSPFPVDELTEGYERAARWIADQLETSRGYCLVLGSAKGRLAYELARRTEMHVIGVEPEEAAVSAARCALDEAGLYGRRITIQRGALDGGLPYPDGFANLIVSDRVLISGEVPFPQAEVRRLLRPCGGIAFFGQPPDWAGERSISAASLRDWAQPFEVDAAAQGFDVEITTDKGRWLCIEREALPGAGEWTHTYADPANTACSRDENVHGPLRLQWFGRPGPRLMIDRHHRNVPPLYKHGRLFVPGDERIMALDAYNGAWLWEVRLPGSRRLGVFLDVSNLVVDDEHLFVAHGERCSTFAAATGTPAGEIVIPQLIRDTQSHWGYVARVGDLLYGTGRFPEAVYQETSYAADAALWYDNMAIVTSRYLFALNAAGRKVRWTYRDGVIINPTITIGGGRIYFIESHSPKALADTTGRMPGGTFLEGGKNLLVALEVGSGRVVYKKEVDLNSCRMITYLNYAREILLLSGCEYVERKLWYSFFAFDSASGRVIWRQAHNSGFGPGGGHGEQNRHPTIVKDTIYTYPYAYTLTTGKRIEGYRFDRSGHGCGGVSGSARALFWRGGNPAMRDLTEGWPIRKVNSVTRPGCWINMIPAGGLLLIPEASSGCTCAFPLQTSLAYRPASNDLDR